MDPWEKSLEGPAWRWECLIQNFHEYQFQEMQRGMETAGTCSFQYFVVETGMEIAP